MIPTATILTSQIEEISYPARTYKILIDEDRISGYTDEIDALMQTIYLILNTERYKFIIYSWDYGVELVDLIGKPMPYVISEAQRRIVEALMQDDRIEEVTDFTFEKNRNTLHITFKVRSIYGTIEVEKEVTV